MALVIVVLIGIAALTGVAVLLAMTDSPLSTELPDRLDDGLPDRQLTSQDVSALRFRTGLRGYRMDEVDLALDRLRDALHQAEERMVAAEQAVAVATLARPTRSRRPAKAVDDEEPETLAKPVRAGRTAKTATSPTPPDDGA